MKLYPVLVYCASAACAFYVFNLMAQKKRTTYGLLLTFFSLPLQLIQAAYVETYSVHNEYMKQWSRQFGGSLFNAVSRPIYSHSHLFTTCLNDGQQLTHFDLLALSRFTSVDTTRYCPSSPIGLIRGLDHSFFTIDQHKKIVELLDELGITLHNFNLLTIVRLTQGKYSADLTPLQHTQLQYWLNKEGEEIEETHDNFKGQKPRLVSLLHSLHVYQTMVPPYSETHPYDYTLLLGGSIQEMQMRFLTLVATFDNFHFRKDSSQADNEQSHRNLGKVVTLTCNRVVNSGYQHDQKLEVDPKHRTVWFEVNDDMVDISEHEKTLLADLTEDTAYKAIVYAVKRMCADRFFFETHRRSTPGFHHQDHLPEEGLASYLYRYTDYQYELTDRFLDASCRFLQHHPEPETFLTPEKPSGVADKERPTTKQTVKEWTKHEMPCIHTEHCHILAISTQPSARYQQVAVLQGVEDIMTPLSSTRMKISLAGLGTSTKIPTDEALENLSRTLYMIEMRPNR